MNEERQPLTTKHTAQQHFELSKQTCDLASDAAAERHGALSHYSDHTRQNPAVDGAVEESEGATVFQTSLNIAKLCMGTGTLALPFAAQKGGLVFNMFGLGVIVVWNYYSADCLLRCLDYLPQESIDQTTNRCEDKCLMKKQEQRRDFYGSTEENEITHTEDVSYTNKLGPPEGTTTYGIVAWHAFGKPGLIVLDLLMISLFVGLLTSYLAAMMSFIDGINQSTGSGGYDNIIPSMVVAILSCARDISFLSKFSAIGLLALALSFGVISWEGFKENGWAGFADTEHLNFWPENLSAASSWFGVVVFGYGVVPVIFNIKDSMSKPQFIGLSTKIGLTIAYVGYLFASNGIRILFSHTHSFDGDVLQALPDSPISLVVRLLMTFVVAVTAPFIVVPCGELLEGKLSINNNDSMHRNLIRILLCAVCTVLAAFVPGFVHIISFVGCFCVSMTGFVLPPLFSLKLSRSKERQPQFERDVGLLILGGITTVITSAMTFHDLVSHNAIQVPGQTITGGSYTGLPVDMNMS